MAGNSEGGKKSADKIKEKYGEDFFRNMGRKGGKACVKKGFATNIELARKAGKKGGKTKGQKGFATNPNLAKIAGKNSSPRKFTIWSCCSEAKNEQRN